MKNVFWLAIIISLTGCRQKTNWVDNHAPAWYKGQIIYNLDVKTFQDSDNDGIGDFKGLTSRLGYLDSLGITAIWLAPFQPSPWQDDGYDVTDYTGIDPRVGTEKDFDQFMQAARQRHIRIIMDVVLNHSSIQHPWFSTRKDWYVRTPKRPADWDKGMGFPGVENETWRADSIFGGYYFHRFYRFQPDLNFQNRAVLAEGKRILTYWLQRGVDGFRLDAVPFIIDDPRPSAEHPVHDFNLLHDIAYSVRKVNPEVALLGEANVKPEETKDYFSKQGEGLDMMLNFEVNEYLFYALASSETKLLKKALQVTAEKPGHDQWVYFLRNHDEIDLGKLSKREIGLVFSKMAPDTGMHLYDRGIRRRLAPMLGNDPRRLRQAYSLLFALPGTAVVRYGEEIGMGDELTLKERVSVRTPMQWNGSINAGFTKGKPFRPLIDSGDYRYRFVNVQQQRQTPASLLNWTSKLIALRKKHPEISQGYWDLPNSDNSHCLMINYKTATGNLLAVFNFSGEEQKLTIPNKAQTVNDLISGQRLPLKDQKLVLPAFAGYWLSDK